MDVCDLSRLSGAGFERLVRALCFSELGLPGVVYSSGPDGGRDFTYDGLIKGYEARKWDGYLVIQAKYRERTSSTDDLAWLKHTLAIEFRKFKSARNVLKPPKYYILATNIRLSGTDGPGRGRRGSRKGGMTKALEFLEEWKRDLGIADFDIWSHDKIVDLLVAHPEIRHAYAAWVTPGDVLTKVLERFSADQPNFNEIINRSLKTQLHRDQFVRLKDAGSVGDLNIRTSQVFVDLPLVLTARDRNVLAHHRVASADEPFDGTAQTIRERAVASLVERSREKLDPDSLMVEEERQGGEERKATRNRIVLIGGPGQGKSTASLFLAQLFRSAILEKQPGTRRDQTVRNLIPEILKRAENENIGKSIPHRYPIHISLPRLADQISQAKAANQAVPSVLAHISAELTISSDQDISKSDLRNWLRAYPWVVLFDGLDEVPPSGERASVIDCISNFFIEVNEVNADVLAAVTTRPQGYNRDLDEKLWEHWRLADLKPASALSYAKAFGEARYKNDPQRRMDVHRQLEKAASQPATARLMISPLQITILYFIVDTGGGVPTARWTLFNEYFEVLKRREKAKGGETQRIIERHLHRLGPIHHRAGLILQTDSEHRGGAGSRLSHARFESLIRNYLDSEGYEPAKVEESCQELMSLALHRLVLLSTQQEGTISFDVRSLQEFMAAAAITSADEQVMEKRLSHIAGHAHWRHVFQIAASRCFSDDSFHYRRSAIVAIPRQLDACDPDRLCLNGSKLALDLVSDGIGLDHPISRRSLILHAMEQLTLGLRNLDRRLGALTDEVDEGIIATCVAKTITDADTDTKLAAWKLLFLLAANGSEWADTHILLWWPTETSFALEIIKSVTHPFPSQAVLDKVVTTLSKAGPVAQYTDLYRLFFSVKERQYSELDYSAFLKLSVFEMAQPDFSSRKMAQILPGTTGLDLNANYISIVGNATYDHFDEEIFADKAWSVLRAAKTFLANPSPSSLAAALATATKIEFTNAQLLKDILPWPMAAVIDSSSSNHDLIARIDIVRLGGYGSQDDWKAAEKRWDTEGLKGIDFEALTDGWISSEIARVGCPYWMFTSGPRGRTKTALAFTEQLRELLDNGLPPNIKAKIHDAATSTLFVSANKMNLAEAQRFLKLLAFFIPNYIPVDTIANLPVETWSDATSVKNLATAISRSTGDEYDMDDATPALLAAFKNFPEERRLLYPLLNSIAVQGRSFDFDELKRVSECRSGDDAKAEAAFCVLKLATTLDRGEMNDCVRMLSESSTSAVGLDLLEKVFSSSHLQLEQRIQVLSLVIEATADNLSGQWKQFVETLHGALDARISGLSEHSIWVEKLNLPKDAFNVILPPGDNPS